MNLLDNLNYFLVFHILLNFQTKLEFRERARNDKLLDSITKSKLLSNNNLVRIWLYEQECNNVNVNL